MACSECRFWFLGTALRMRTPSSSDAKLAVASCRHFLIVFIRLYAKGSFIVEERQVGIAEQERETSKGIACK